MALQAGSPANDVIPAASCPAADQRGVSRPDNGETACDIGAYEFADYPFTGFLPPVANPPAVNMVNAGQSIPLQFQLGGNQGMNIIAAGYPTAQQVSCASGAPINTSTETDTAGSSGLQYNATTGTYTYVWKTSKASKGTCQVFTLKLNDGTTHTANFQYVN
jgi:hypothetical protein